MTQTEEHEDVVVVGGGLAGLTAAATAARAGARVRVLERGLTFGGRARTKEEGGFALNYGPHALYRKGAGMRVLTSLGVEPDGAPPKLDGAAALIGDRLDIFPVTAAALMRTGLLGVADKFEFGRIYERLSSGAAKAQEGESFADAIVRMTKRRRVVAVLEALVRLATYANAPEELDAAAAFTQLRMASSGVVYLHGGWAALVETLRARTEAAGARLSVEAGVDSLSCTEGLWRLRTARGEDIETSTVILAVDPAIAAGLAPDVARLQHAAANAVPVRAMSLDVGLSKLPRPDRTFALGVDRPLYFSVHSDVAQLAPRGGALIHVSRYMASDEAAAPWMRAELEGVLDVMQPGWRDVVVTTQFLAGAIVSHDVPRVAPRGVAGGVMGGMAARMPVEAGSGLFAAGDWVGDEGLLSDAAFASGARAGEAAAACAATARVSASA